MATLEDKILGEKNEYYCSSSEDEDEDDFEENNRLENLNSTKNESYSINVSLLFFYILLHIMLFVHL
jgi:phosducin-like protein